MTTILLLHYYLQYLYYLVPPLGVLSFFLLFKFQRQTLRVSYLQWASSNIHSYTEHKPLKGVVDVGLAGMPVVIDANESIRK